MDNVKSAGFLLKFPGYLTPGMAGILKRKPSWVLGQVKPLERGFTRIPAPLRGPYSGKSLPHRLYPTLN
jgi:hypothetical protein